MAPGVHGMPRRSALVIRVLRAVSTPAGSRSFAHTCPVVIRRVLGGPLFGPAVGHARAPGVAPRGSRRTWYAPEVGTGDPSPPGGVDACGVWELCPDLSGSVRRVPGGPLFLAQRKAMPGRPALRRVAPGVHGMSLEVGTGVPSPPG
jgi:hypothetical protein